MQRAKGLRSRAIEYYNSLQALTFADKEVLATFFQIYDKIRNDVIGLFHSDTTVHSLPFLSVKMHYARELVRLIVGLDQVIGFLEGKQVDVLGTTVRTFPYQEKELDILPTTTKLLLQEAIEEYNHFHSYACCCICGLAFQSLVQEGCKKIIYPIKVLLTE